MTDAVPLVAVVGRPNVGKSSLVNRIIGRREAIVEETPGVTRDRRSFTAEWGGRRFEIVDTGGLEPGAEGLEARVVEQAHAAIETADAIVLVVDAVVGPLEDDLLVADLLRRSGKPVVVAANKVDDGSREAEAAAFYRLGLGDPMPVSALHGRGSGDLLDAVSAVLPRSGDPVEGPWASVAIVGRPNVGKSSLLNRLVGEERAIVDPVPGTTRDPVDALLALEARRSLRIVDTAGMRRRVQIKDPVEYFSFLRSQRVLERVDAVFLVTDAAQGVTGHDQRLAEAVVEEGRACVVVLNKWDLVSGDEADLRRHEDAFRRKLRFLDWAPLLRTSALTGRGLQRLVPALEDSVAAHRRRLETSAVNRMIQDAQRARAHPRSGGGRGARILYAVQAAVSPPTFVLFATRALEESYRRYLENRLRAAGGFEGTPIRLRVRIRSRDKVEA